jgi:L-alanine-DL-glutamate epimerase-like enolase superfamily enzyme
MKWSVDEAIRAARAFQQFDLTWLEEPTVPEDPEGHARIVREGGLPIAAGENLRTVWEFKQYIDCGGVTFPEPDVTNCGGVTAFIKIAHLAEAFNLPVTSHGAHDVTVHLLAACPNRSYWKPMGSDLNATLRSRCRSMTVTRSRRGVRVTASSSTGGALTG